MRKALGPLLLGVLVVGDVLGAGIYILVGEVAAEVGGLVWVPFLVAFALAALTATSYVELVTAYPHAAGSAHWVDVAFGRPLLTFMVGFVVAMSAVSTGAAVSRAVGGQYLTTFVDLPVVPVALAAIVVLSTLAWVGLSESARANAVMTAVEVAGLVLVLVAGVVGFARGDAEPERLVDTVSVDPGVGGILAASALAFFAYLGFEDAVHLSEEVREPRRSFPQAMFSAMAVVGVLYLGVTVSASALVDPAQLGSSSAPLLAAIDAGPIPVPAEVFAAIAVVAVTNTALLALTTASRQVYGLAEKGSIPAVLGRVGRRRTPTVAIVAVAVVAGALATTGGVRDLADTTVALLLGVFAMVNTIVVLLRRRGREGGQQPVGFRAPLWIPVMGALATGALLIHTLVVGGLGLYVRLGILGILGVGLYALARWGDRRRR